MSTTVAVRFLTSVAGPRFSFAVDDVVRLPEAEAREYLGYGWCERVGRSVPAEPETATAQPKSERATKPPTRKRTKKATP